MTTTGGHRAGMAIVRIELERVDDATRLLVRVSTVDDVMQPGPLPLGTPHADLDAALAYLREWLEQWVAQP